MNRENLLPPYGQSEWARFHPPADYPNDTYNPITAIKEIAWGQMQYYNVWQQSGVEYHYPASFFQDIRRYIRVEDDLKYYAVGLAVLWTIMRYSFTWFFAIPVGKMAGLSKLNQGKFPESAWKAFAYALMWLWSLRVCFFSGHDFFWNTLHLWADHDPGRPPWDLTSVYLLQFSFYLHSVYGTLFMDHRRKDTLIMLFHHFLTMSLLLFGYGIRCVKIGVMLLVLNDICDVFLELAKIGLYFKRRADGSYHKFWAFFGDFFTFNFGFWWLILRLWLYLCKVLRSVAFTHYVSAPVGFIIVPFIPIFTAMLATLGCLNLYWWSFVLIFVVKVLKGEMTEVEDMREYEAQAEIEQKKKKET